MSLRWRDDLFSCSIRGRTVLLDMRTGRYAGVSARAGGALERLRRRGQLDPCGRRALASMIERGLLIPTPGTEFETAQAAPPAPTADMTCDAASVGRSGHFISAFVAHLVARCALRIFGFARVYRALRWREGRAAAHRWRYDAPRVAKLAMALDRAELLLARQDRCLSRSVAFKLLARLHRIDVTLVIGVEMQPFSAHCWIEHDGCVLNGPIDEVTPFTPILAV